MIKLLISFLTFLAIGCSTLVQSAPPFWSDVHAFQIADRLHAPVVHPILFIGSSSFTKWKTVGDDFPGYPILNRAFGGSTLTDVIHYADDVIVPYRPKQVVIYCGENDAATPGVTALQVAERFKTLFGIIRKHFPDAQVSYVSMKASPSRARFAPVVREANRLINDFLAAQSRADFIDVATPMLDARGKVREELFLADRLHMKPEGYAIWTRVIAPYLSKG